MTMHPVVPGGITTTLPLSPGFRAGDFVYVSGLVAANPDGTFVTGDPVAEVDGAIDLIESVMVEAGGSLAHVVKVTAYLSNAQLFPTFNEVFARRFPHRPARATLVVGFVHPDVRVELEAVGYLGARGESRAASGAVSEGRDAR